MEFSRNWVGRYVELPETIEELCEKLTASGLAVEGLETRGDDVLMDLDVTTNRPDCMNHLGLAREVAVLFDRTLDEPAPALDETEERTAEIVTVEVSTPDCPEYVARVVRDVKVGPSPDWLREQLEAIGQRSINNVVDVTNFVLWETGQPIHAFDLAKIADARIEVRYAREGEALVTLDGETRKLTPEILLIADADGPVALAGIMGGLDSEVTESTRDILIESAHFDRTAVRLGARALGMHTDASHRFERGADPKACRHAADRVAELLIQVGGGRATAGAIENPHPEYFGTFEGTVDLARLNGFAGVEYPADRVEHYLKALGFEPRSGGDGRLDVTVPSWRYYDFWQRREDGRIWEADLFEEAMRMFGFDRIPATLPAVGPPDLGSSREHVKRERIRRALSSSGFAEAINFAFGPSSDDGLFPGLESSGEPVEIANPLSEQYAVMRRSLLPNLLESARFNLRRGADAVRLFEIGRLFPGVDSEEVEAIAVIAGGRSPLAWDRQQEVDFFELKGVLEALFEKFDSRLQVRAAVLVGFVDGRACEILDGDRCVGYLGEIADADAPYPLFGAELASGALTERELPEAVQAPSKFPSISADLTLTHGADVSWGSLSEAIEASGAEDLAEFGLRDVYQGKGVPEGAVNTTIYFLYNATDRSLTQNEVNERQASLTAELEKRFGWKS